MGVPNQNQVHHGTCTLPQSGDAVSSETRSKTSKSKRAGNGDKPSVCTGHRISCPSFPVTLPDPPAEDTTTLAAQETAKYDCGSTVEMWFMCRLFSPRRRQQRRSLSDSGGQQQDGQPQGEQDSVAESPGGAQTARSGRCQGICTAGCRRGDLQEMENEEENLEDTVMDTKRIATTRDSFSGGGDGVDLGDGDHDVDDGEDDRSSTVNKEHGHPDDLARNVSHDDTDGDEGLKEQLAMVQAMVQEMKGGFMAALDQLSTLQDGEQSSWHKMDSTCKRQDQQLSDLAHCVDSLRNEVSTLSKNVSEVMNTQKSLQDRLVAIQTGQHQLLQELFAAGVLSEQSRDNVAKCSATEGDGAQDVSNHRAPRHTDITDSQGSKEQETKRDVTAAACKSLSLTQALAARCQDIDVSDSSEEDMASSRDHRQGADDHHSLSAAGADPPQRRQAVQEIVDSEQEYCAQLWTVVNLFQLPLQEGHYMSSRQLSILFPSPLGDLCEQHSQMLQSLQDRLVHWSYSGVVGDVFARMIGSNSNLLGLYQEYIESLPASISCLRRQMAQSRSFRLFAKEQREVSPNTDLLTLLISPLQRIPKYMLQLQQVLRHTSEDHPDHFNLQASLSQLQDFVERFNHDITHTTQAIALDLQHLQAQGASFRSSASGSSCEVLPPTTSTIDSGIHSTGEDTFPPGYLRNGPDHYDGYLPQWLEQNTGYHHTDPRHAMVMQHRAQPQSRPRAQSLHSHMTSHSQPNLSHTGYVMPSHADPQASVPQIRGYTKMAATIGEGSARQRRYRIKKRMEDQDQYVNQSPLRPASAMDFGEPPQVEERESAMMRPHSVLGPFPGDGRTRVIQVHSRRPPRPAHRPSDSTQSSSAPIQHVIRSSPQSHVPNPHVVLNGHWDPAAGGDPAGHYGSLVDYDDEEDDTRAPSDTHSGSSHKASSRHSQDAQETETDNSEDYSQEDLAAALSHHLNSGGGGSISAHDLRIHQQQYKAQQLHPHNGHLYPSHHSSEQEEDEHVDVQLDSPESDYLHSQQSQKPPENMSEELKLDLTCFHEENEGKPSLLKRSQPPAPCVDSHVPLSMKPLAGNVNNSADIVPTVADRSLTEPPKEVVSSLTADKTITSLPPIHPQDPLPTVADTNGRTLQPEVGRLPVRRSVTPNEFSGVNRPTVLRRAATPSEYLGASDSVNSKGGRRRKDAKNTSSENLHRSIDDVSLSASKKKPFRTSLKNLFHRKKGSVILDELEREYTKELVQQCLNNNGHTSPSSKRTTNTTTATNNNNSSNQHSGQVSDGNEEKQSDNRKLVVSMNNLNNNNHSNHQQQGHGLWFKMRTSPLFSLSRGADGSAADATLV